MNKKHHIVDIDTENIVGYTVDGTLGSLLIYMDDGEYFHDQLHGETYYFEYYCKWYNWNYRLEDLDAVDFVEETASNDTVIFVEALREVFDQLQAGLLSLSENDMLQLMRQSLAKRSLEKEFTCSDASLLLGYGPTLSGVVVTFKIHFRLPVSHRWLADVVIDAELADLKYDFTNKELDLFWEYP